MTDRAPNKIQSRKLQLAPVGKAIDRALLMVINIPTKLRNSIEERAKRRSCLAQVDTVFYPMSQIRSSRGRDKVVIGSNTHILGRLSVFAHGGQIEIGNDCYVGEYSQIWSFNSVVIGDRVQISHGVNIHDNNAHSLSAQRRHNHFKAILSTGHPKVLDDVPAKPIVIEDDAWIGFNSTILKGVTIGRGAVVGANTVVTKDVAPYTVVVGNPARVIGESYP